jgi:hypothetical protein
MLLTPAYLMPLLLLLLPTASAPVPAATHICSR